MYGSTPVKRAVMYLCICMASLCLDGTITPNVESVTQRNNTLILRSNQSEYGEFQLSIPNDFRAQQCCDMVGSQNTEQPGKKPCNSPLVVGLLDSHLGNL